MEGRTKDVSSTGFYCLVIEPPEVGQVIRYSMFVPAFDVEKHRNVIELEGSARVLRCDMLGSGVYGIACQGQDYQVVGFP